MLAKAKWKNVCYRYQEISDGMIIFFLVGKKYFVYKFQKMYLMVRKMLGNIKSMTMNGD